MLVAPTPRPGLQALNKIHLLTANVHNEQALILSPTECSEINEVNGLLNILLQAVMMCASVAKHTFTDCDDVS